MGRILFARGNYQQAIICFDRADLPLLRDISDSYHLRKQARLLAAGSARRKAAFFDVGNHFLKCGAGEHEQSQKCYIRAGECYAEAGKNIEASDAFCKAKEFTKGAQYSRKAADFDRAVEIVQSYPVDEPVAAKIISVCQVQFLREKAYK
jgi:tetratricopeptide (TPR) repeat protein